jgi:hypothetical protein
VCSYNELKRLIDAKAGDVNENIEFRLTRKGKPIITRGNVLSREGVNEDPWICFEGDHFSGVCNQKLIWGENGFGELQEGPFTVGMLVDYNYQGGGAWYEYQIKKVNNNGSYAVAYPDGAFYEPCIDASLLRPKIPNHQKFKNSVDGVDVYICKRIRK